MNVTIRPATNEDMPTILSVLNYGVRNKIRRGDLAWGEKDIEPNSIIPFVQNGTAYIADLNGQPVGVFMLDWQDEINWGLQPPTACYLQRFAVAAGFGGQNIGGQILDLVAETIKSQRNLSSIRLVCPSSNAKLRAYYEKRGFIRADSKAKPAMPRTTVVYYERNVSDVLPAPPKKTGSLRKIRNIFFNTSSHE